MIYIAFKSCINEAHRQKRSSYSVRKFLNLSALVFRGRSQADPDSFTFVLLAMFNICQSRNLKIPDFCLPVSPPPLFYILRNILIPISGMLGVYLTMLHNCHKHYNRKINIILDFYLFTLFSVCLWRAVLFLF